METQLFRKKDKPNSPPVQKTGESDKFIHLSNGDTVLKQVFSTLYESYDGTMGGGISMDDEVDPRNFLNSTKLGNIVNQFTKGFDDKSIPQQPVTQVRQEVEQPAPVIKIDNTANAQEVDELFEDEVAVYGVVEATRRKRERIRGGGTAVSNQVINNDTASTQQNVQQNQPTPQNQPVYKNAPVVSPTEMMFKSFKRNHEIVFKFEFKEMIGNPDFVKMMLANIDGDIVSYYKGLIMESIMSQTARIEKEVENQIKKEIFGDEPDKKTAKTKKKPVTKTKKVKVEKVKAVKAETVVQKVVEPEVVVIDIPKQDAVIVPENFVIPEVVVTPTVISEKETVITNPNATEVKEKKKKGKKASKGGLKEFLSDNADINIIDG